MSIPPAVGWSVLALVLLDELLVMASLAVWGADVSGWVMAVLAGAAGVLVWFLFASPKARYGGPVARPVAKVLVIGSGVVGLAVAGHVGWALALAVFSVVVNGIALHPDVARLPEVAGGPGRR